MAELTDVQTDRCRGCARSRWRPRTRQRVVAALGGLGLASRPNLHYGRAVSGSCERFGAERFAVIDVGTNSVKFHLAERRRDGSWQTVVDRADVTRLGDGLRQTGRLGPEPMERTVEAIAGMAEEARRHRVGAIAAVGTAGMRTAANGAEFVAAVEERCGVRDRDHLGRGGGAPRLPRSDRGLAVPGSCVVFDTGGGSSQFSFGQGGRVEERFSVEVGAVRLTEGFGLAGAVTQNGSTRPAPRSPPISPGSTTGPPRMRCSAWVERSPTSPPSGTAWRSTTQTSSRARCSTGRRSTDRSSSTGPATPPTGGPSSGSSPRGPRSSWPARCIVRTVLDMLGGESLTVSDRGLRYGVLTERFGLDD